MKYCPQDGFKFVGRYCSICGKTREELVKPPETQSYEDWYRST